MDVLTIEEECICLYTVNDVEEISAIFNRSYRKDASRRDGQLGLGLHIVKQLMEKQGGEVTV